MSGSLTKFCELYEAIEDAYGVALDAKIDWLIDCFNDVRSSSAYVKWRQKVDWAQKTITVIRANPRYRQYEKILIDQLMRIGRGYLHLCTAYCPAQAQWDWWHDPVTGIPIPWRNSALWPDGEFKPEYAPPPDVVADMKSRLSPGDWKSVRLPRRLVDLRLLLREPG